MRSSVSLLAVLALLAGHVLALNILIGGQNIAASAFLNAQDVVRTNCNKPCDQGQSDIDACNGDDTCLCNFNTTLDVFSCQECMFTQLITLNKRPDDPLAGQASALTAYANACNASLGVFPPANHTTLTLPDNWEGPFGQGLTAGTTVIAVGAAFILGLGSITIVNTM